MLAIYCRISVDRPEQKSIKEQKLQGIEFANSNDYEYKVFIDKGISGGAIIEDRPAFNQLINEIKEDKITALFIYNQDRAERSEVTWFTLANLILDKNIKFYEEGVLVDLTDPTVFFTKGMLSQMNSFYRKSTKKKITDVLHRNLEEGKTRGILPYGYKKDENGYMIIDKEEALIVKEIYELSLKGIGTRTIAENLTERQIPTRYNKIKKGTIKTKNKYTGNVTVTKKEAIKWASNTIRGIIINQVYKGVRIFGKEERRTEYKSPIIIEPTYWQKVNDNLKNNANNSGKKVFHKYLLKGVLRCGNCGRNYYGRTRVNKKDNYYMCSSKRLKSETCKNRSINIDYLESVIWSQLFKDGYLISEIEKYFKDSDEKEVLALLKKDLKVLGKNLLDSKSELNNVQKYLLKNLLNEQEAKNNIERIRVEQNDTKIKITNIKEQIRKFENLEETKNNLIEPIQNLKENTSFNDKQVIINKYLKDIKIDYKENIFFIEIEYKFPVPNHILITDRLYKKTELLTSNLLLRDLNNKIIFTQFDKIEIGKLKYMFNNT